jgi:hypothetical protein
MANHVAFVEALTLSAPPLSQHHTAPLHHLLQHHTAHSTRYGYALPSFVAAKYIPLTASRRTGQHHLASPFPGS